MEKLKIVKNIRGKVTAFSTIAVLLTIGIGFLVSVYFFGFAGLFNLFGVKYDSLLTVLTFIVFVLIIGIFTDIFAKIPAIIFSQLLSGKYALIIGTLIIEAFFTWIAIYTADELLTGLNIPLKVEIIAAFILSIAEYLLDQDDKKEIESNGGRDN